MSFAPESETMVSIIFIGYLTWVSWQDYKSMEVVRYSHGLGLLAVILQIILQVFLLKEGTKEYFIAYLIASFLAAIFLLCMQAAAGFFHLYGVADAIVLFVCGLFLLAQRGPEQYLPAYLMVTALSGCMFLVVQALKGNIKGMGLKCPVPYIPYISVAFILTKWVL